MKITIDENGCAKSDVEAVNFVQQSIDDRTDIHTSQEFVILLARATLVKLDPAKRPVIEWEVYGKKVNFDKDLRSNDAYLDPRMNFSDGALNAICWPSP